MKTSNTKGLVYGAIIAAMYTVLTMISYSMGLANGVIQVRISEALTILPFFSPHAIGGLFAGCIISNIITGCALWDTVFGSIATLIGAVVTYRLSKINSRFSPYLAPLGPIVSNTCIIPMILTYVYGVEESLPFIILTVGAGEVISCGVLGMILLFALKKHSKTIFH